MNPARIESLKLKISDDLTLSPHGDNEVLLVCHEQVAKRFVAHLERNEVQSVPSYVSLVNSDQDLAEIFLSLSMNEAEMLRAGFVQELQEIDLKTIQETHPHIFIGGKQAMRL